MASTRTWTVGGGRFSEVESRSYPGEREVTVGGDKCVVLLSALSSTEQPNLIDQMKVLLRKRKVK